MQNCCLQTRTTECNVTTQTNLEHLFGILNTKFMMTQTKLEKKFDSRINHAPDDFDAKKDLPEGFYEFLESLHLEFTPRQQQLAKKRAEVLADSREGNPPNHLPASEATKGDWKIALPKYVEDQRNQMTGPADDAELTIKMLNSGALGVMIDLEDSMANVWENLEQGIENSLKALHGELTYYDKKRERETAINESQTVTMIRVRGLHSESSGNFRRSAFGFGLRHGAAGFRR